MLKEIRDLVEECIVKAETFYGESIPRPKIRFDLKGKTAGQSNFGKGYLRFNVQMANTNGQAFLDRTVPHEVAHWVQRWKFGYRDVKPHGREWKSIMIRIFGLAPSRCHSYSLEGVTVRKQRRYEYTCGCRTHSVSATKHNRIRRGVPYSCRRCGMPVRRSQEVARKTLTVEEL